LLHLQPRLRSAREREVLQKATNKNRICFFFFSFFRIKKEKQGMRTKERTNKQTQDDERDRESFTNGITNPRVANKH
jgi:hypothetical protein